MRQRQLDVLRVECTKCDRKGRYSVAKLIEKYGRKGNMMKWREMLNADCPKRDATGLLPLLGSGSVTFMNAWRFRTPQWDGLSPCPT